MFVTCYRVGAENGLAASLWMLMACSLKLSAVSLSVLPIYVLLHRTLIAEAVDPCIRIQIL